MSFPYFLSPVSLAFNPQWVKLCFSIFLGLVSLLVLHPHTLSMTFPSLSFFMFPLFTFVLRWLDLDKHNSSDPWYLVLALAFHRIEQIWGSMLPLSLPCAQHTQHLNSCQSGRHCRDQCSVAFCQAITTLHQQPCHLSPPTHTYVPLCHCAFTTLDCLSNMVVLQNRFIDNSMLWTNEQTWRKQQFHSSIFLSWPLFPFHGPSCIWVKVRLDPWISYQLIEAHPKALCEHFGWYLAQGCISDALKIFWS